jgi:hypothetical protein
MRFPETKPALDPQVTRAMLPTELGIERCARLLPGFDLPLNLFAELGDGIRLSIG